MRAAAVVSAAMVALGAYLAVAATLSISPSWIAFGILAIATVSAMAVVLPEGSSAPSSAR
ncbi:MAG: hypothetical protein QOI85_1726 [Chloroflexota bacterium]|jgi:hypothetical protein|nr:hypothetical protein [Chloroflexota bacterium]